MTTPMLRPLDFSGRLDAGFTIYRNHFASLVRTVAVVVVPVQIAALTIMGALIFGAFDLDSGGTDTDLDARDWLVFAGFLATTLIGFVARLVATGAVMKAIADTYLGRTPDWGESLQFALSRFRSIALVTALAGILGALAFIALIVPGVYLFVAWSVAIPVLLLEGHRGRAALKRSRHLVKGLWWGVAGTLLVVFLIASVATGILTAVVEGVVSVSGGNDTFGGFLVNGLLTTAAEVIFMPLTAAITVVIYFDLRVRKEGFDVTALARAIDAPGSGGSGGSPGSGGPGGLPPSAPPPPAPPPPAAPPPPPPAAPPPSPN